MFLTEWKSNEDGSVVSAQYSITGQSAVILDLRCVRMSNGGYEALLRDGHNGLLLGSRVPKEGEKYSLEQCKIKCLSAASAMMGFESKLIGDEILPKLVDALEGTKTGRVQSIRSNMTALPKGE